MTYRTQVEVETLLAFAAPALHVSDTHWTIGARQRPLSTQEIATPTPARLHPNGEIHVAVVFDLDRRFGTTAGLSTLDGPLLDEPDCDGENRDEGGEAEDEGQHE